jgi:hypothetical protein
MSRQPMLQLMTTTRVSVLALLLVCLPVAAAAQDETELAKQTQNPIADLISLPIQSNFNLGAGSSNDLQYIANIQPVVPVGIGDWLMVNRPILPVLYQPELAPGVGEEWGIGDLVYQSYFVPPDLGGGLTLGFGPVFSFPTATDDALGSGKWAAGPGVVAMLPKGPWVIGGLANHVWSFAGDSDRGDVTFTTIQPFINFNLPRGLYLVAAPIMTADWERDSGDRWTVPLGGGIGKVFKLGKLPINTSVQAYYNVERPDGVGRAQIRFQIQALFPKRDGS